MEYITAQAAAEKWAVTLRHVQSLCAKGKIDGAMRFSSTWAIPAHADKPADGRRKMVRNEQPSDAEILQFAPEKDEYLASVVERFPYAIALFTPDGTLTYANDAYFETFYITDKMKVLGKLNLLEDEITRNSGMLDIALKSLRGESFKDEERKVPVSEVAKFVGSRKTPDGIFYQSLLSFPIYDKNGVYSYVVTVFMPTREYKGRHEFIKGREYIENHWMDRFDLDSVASASGLSRAQFTKTFRDLSGMTPYEYYLNVKVDHMKETLLNPNISISQAFAACGLDYNGYYAKLFKRLTGLTPLQYRKNNR